MPYKNKRLRNIMLLVKVVIIKLVEINKFKIKAPFKKINEKTYFSF
jgi:hypothetical protein